MHHITDQVKEWIVQQVGNDITIVNTIPLLGGVSASMYEVILRQKELQFSLVIRLFTDQKWFQEEPDLVRHETASLQMVRNLPIPTPEWIASDETGDSCGYPAVLITKLEGAVDLTPQDRQSWLLQMAQSLHRIHTVPPISFPWKYFPYHDIDQVEIPTWSTHGESWKRALDFVRTYTPKEKSYFIHRDYHPANLLWKDGQMSGVVDWTNACIGPNGVDVGHLRLNLALLYGVEMADQFLEAYYSLSDTSISTHNPYWDLKSVLDWDVWEPPTVYRGWTDLGVKWLTDQVMQERFEQYLCSLVARV